MGADMVSAVDLASPEDSWAGLNENTGSVLIDVRTSPEWDFVGKPDLSGIGREVLCIEWSSYPEMTSNPRFAELLFESIDTATVSELYFICRSGARSLKAAKAVHDACLDRGLSIRCVNVEEGFEGDLDALKKRGGLNGWKARGLPWLQS